MLFERIRMTLLTFLVIPCIGNGQGATQTIRGKVTDAGGFEVLPGAVIQIPEQNLNTITDGEGNFSLEGVPVGRYNLEVSYLGYHPEVVPELLVSSGKEVVLEIRLKEKTTQIAEVVVKPSITKDKALNPMAMVSSRAFSVEEARRFAGGLDDPARMAGSFAGVTPMGINNNAIVVRGNAPKGLLWRLDGVDIPCPAHFAGSNVSGGGGITIFSSQMLTNSDFYTGAFPAEFGNATGGVFDMKLRTGNNRKYEYTAQIGIQGLEAGAEGPLKQGRQGSFLFNYRYSTMGLIYHMLPETRDANELPIYQDLSFKVMLPGSRAGVFSLWGIGGLSKTTSMGADVASEWIYTSDRKDWLFKYNMGVLGLTHHTSLTNKSHLRTTLALNGSQHVYSEMTRFDNQLPSLLQPILDVDNMEGRLILSSVLHYKQSSRIGFQTGIKAEQMFYNMQGKAVTDSDPQYKEVLNGKGRSLLMTLFVQGYYQMTPEVAITAGLNGSRFEMNGEVLVEPRFSAEWQFAKNHRLSVGYGRHSQTEPLNTYFVVSPTGDSRLDYPNKHLKRMRSDHLVLAYDWRLAENMRLKVEPYYQWLRRVPVVPGTSWSMINFKSDWTFNRPLINNGTGTNKGIDLTLERFLSKGYYFLTTTSIYQSRYTGDDGVERRTRYDGGYVVNMLGGKEFVVRARNLLGISLKLALMGPVWYQPVDVEASLAQQDIVYDALAPFSERHNTVETATDLTINYRINRPGHSSIVALQLKNLAGRQYTGKLFNIKEQAIEEEFFSSIVPFISYKIEF